MTKKACNTIGIRESVEQRESNELWMSSTALNAALQQIMASCPQLVAVGWAVEGETGSLSMLRAADGKLVVPAGAPEKVKLLAAFVECLPAALRETFDLQLDLLDGKRDLAACRAAQKESGQPYE